MRYCLNSDSMIEQSNCYEWFLKTRKLDFRLSRTAVIVKTNVVFETSFFYKKRLIFQKLMCLFQNFINLNTIFHHSPFNVSVNIHDSLSENPLEVRYFNININVRILILM